MKRKTIIFISLGIIFVGIVTGGIYMNKQGLTFQDILPFFQKGIIAQLTSLLLPHTTNNPPTSGRVTEGTYTISTQTALTETCIGQINASDGVWCLENEGTNARDAYFKTNFTMPSGTINSILITGEGKSTSTSAGTCTLGLFNYTSGAWVTKNSSSCTSTADVVLTYNISSSAEKTNFINGGGVTQAMFVILSTAVTDDLNLDYMSASVDYTGPADSPPTWQNPSVNDSTPDPNQIISHNINWTDNALSYATLEINGTGASCSTTANVSSTTLSGLSQWANLSWVVGNSCEGKAVGWRQYANDSLNQWNVTDLQTYTVNNVNPIASFGTNPIDNLNSTSTSITFELKGSDNLLLSYLIIYSNWSGSWIANSTNATPINDTYWNITINGIPEGKNHKWAVWVNDSLNNQDFSDTNRTLNIDATAPTLTNANVNDTTIFQNEYFCINVTATDSTGVDKVLAEINDTSSFVNYSMTDTGSTTCDGGSGDTIYGANIQGVNVGNWTYSRVFSNDTFGNMQTFDFTDIIINVSQSPDSVYPQFSGFTSVPSNNSIYAFGTNYKFNSTVTFTNDTVFLNFNNINYSATNDTQTIYNTSIGDLSAGNYNYYWFSYGNGTNKNYNQSDTFVYAVQKNGISCGVNFNETSPITYPAQFQASSNCSSGFVLYRNGTAIGNNSIQSLGAGAYNFTVIRNDTQNYTIFYEERIFIVNQATPIITKLLNSVADNLTITYPSQVNASGSTTGGTINIFRNGTDVTSENNNFVSLSTSYYEYKFNVTGNENYTSLSGEFLYAIINKNTSGCNVFFNRTSPLTYPDSLFNTTTDCTSDYTLRRNGTTITNNSLQSLPAGFYNFSVIRTDNENYTNISDQENFLINKGTGEVFAYINNSRSNQTIVQNREAYLNSTLNVGSGKIKLYYNNTKINDGNSPLANLTNFTDIGLWNVSGIYEGNENYTEDIETWWANVTEFVPQQINMTNAQNFTQEANNSFSFNFDASGGTIDTWRINDTANFTINSGSGVVTNTTALNTIYFYVLNLSVNNTEGSLDWEVITINITEQTPDPPSSGGLVFCRFRSFGIFNERIPFYREANCI